MSIDAEVWVRFPALPDFLRRSGSGTASTQPREYNWGATRKKSSGSALERREYGHRDPSRWPHGTLYLQKLEVTSPTSGGRSISIVHLRTQATEFSFNFLRPISGSCYWSLSFWISHQNPMCIPFLLHMCWVVCASRSPLLDHSNYIWWSSSSCSYHQPPIIPSLFSPTPSACVHSLLSQIKFRTHAELNTKL
jgi:hypothetical protein